MEDLIELLVKKKAPKSSLIIKGLLVGVDAFLVLFTLLLMSTVLLIATVGLIIITVFIFEYFDCEYEYVLVGRGRDMSLTIDRLLGKKYRKNMIKISSGDMSKLELFLPGSDYGNMKIIDYSACDSEYPDKAYCMNIKYNNEPALLIFNPNEKLLDKLRSLNI